MCMWCIPSTEFLTSPLQTRNQYKYSLQRLDRIDVKRRYLKYSGKVSWARVLEDVALTWTAAVSRTVRMAHFMLVPEGRSPAQPVKYPTALSAQPPSAGAAVKMGPREESASRGFCGAEVKERGDKIALTGAHFCFGTPHSHWNQRMCSVFQLAASSSAFDHRQASAAASDFNSS